MTIAGNVTGGITTQGINLNLFGTSVTRGNSIVTGAISDGGAAGGLSVTAGDNNFTMWVLSGNNSYTGVTNVNGRLNIRSVNALGSTVGGTVVTNNGNAALELQGAGISYAAEALSLSGTGNSGNGALRNISGNNTWTGAITLAGAANIISNANTLTIDVASGNAITATNQNLTLGGAGNGEVKDAIATGSGTLTKVDAGTWTLSANNSYSGLTTVTTGALSVTGSLNSGNALTLASSGTANFANAGQNLGAVSNSNTAVNALNFSNATGTVILASLSGSGNTRFGSNGTITGGISTGTVTSVGALSANITGGTTTAGGLLTGTISSGTIGAGSLSSTSITGGTNTITGAAGITTLNGGTTTVGGVATISTVTTGTVNLNGATSTITTLNGGSVNLGSTTLTVGSGTTSGAITGASGALTVTGALVLNGSNTYGGITSVSAGGDLRVNGTNSGGGAVNVASGANLGGSGGVIGGINVSGVLAPGNSIESLGGGALSFTTGSTYAYELQTNLFAGTPNVAGDLTYSSSTLNIAAGTILTLTDLGGSTVLANGSKLTLISSVGAWNLGLFSYNAGAGLATLADDSTFTLGANIWKFDYNDIVAGSNFTGNITGATNYVTLTVIPEPNLSVLLGGLGVLALLRRRR
jgi:autotransporter-associated beta strand protein